MDNLMSSDNAGETSCTPAQFCMICLDCSTESKLYPVNKYSLDLEFKNLTGILLQDKMHFEPQFCAECAQRLSNCSKFRSRSLRAYQLLMEIVDNHETVTMQKIKAIDRNENRLASNIAKKVYSPNHCDFHFVNVNNNTKEVHVKNESNDTVFDNAGANVNCDIKCEVNLVKDDIDDTVFLKNDIDNDMDVDIGKDSDVDCLEDDNDTDLLNEYDSYVSFLNKNVNNKEHTKNLTNKRKVHNNRRNTRKKDVFHKEIKVGANKLVLVRAKLAKSKNQNNVRPKNTKKFVELKIENENVSMDEDEVSIKNEESAKATAEKKPNPIKEVNERKIAIKNRTNLAKLKKQDRSKARLKNAIRDRTKQIKKETQISVKKKPVKRASASEGDTRKVVVKKVKKKRVYIPTGNPPGPKPGFKSELKLFETTELSHEEQIAEVQARKETERYRNALFKCTICFKGFRDVDAYNGHLDRHTDKYGPFECAFCRLHSKDKHALCNHLANNHNYVYRCKECGFVTKHRHVASNHERWHDGKTYKCPHCDEQFMKSTSVMSHVRIKHPSDYVCTQCGFSFIGERGLNLHMSKKHRLEDTKNLTGPLCEPCNIRFASDTAYKQHMEVSPKHAPASKLKPNCPIQKYAWHLMKKNKEGEMSIDCEQCGANLSNARQYTIHFRKHHPDKNRTQFPKAKVMCEQCGKVFKCMTELKYHMPLHADKKQFTCEICNKSFGRILNLKIHLRTHSDTRPKYECTVCGKTYLNLWGKMRHMRSHQDTRPYYTCDVCEKTFTSPQGRDSHVLHVHNNVPRPKRIRGPRSTPRQHARYTSDSQDS